jgi:predicted DNA-binding transcriptional regulator AlpA
MSTKKKLLSSAAAISAQAPPTRVRLMSRAEVMEVVPFAYVSIWKMMLKGEFPRGREVGGKICWVESEIERWIASRPVKKLKGEPGAKVWRRQS